MREDFNDDEETNFSIKDAGDHFSEIDKNPRVQNNNWQFCNSKNMRRSFSSQVNAREIPTFNRFQPLSVLGDESQPQDDLLNVEMDVNPVTRKKPPSKVVAPTKARRPNVVINNFPETNTIHRTHAKHIPGNSSYADILKKGPKTLILSDSICSRLQMKRFNNCFNNSICYKKIFPGCTVKELKHYCLFTLMEDCPDNVILNVGCNSINKDNPQEIANDVLDIVDLCHLYGVGGIFVATIICRKNFQDDIDEVNNILRSNESLREFQIIDNGNITYSHIWRDNYHLNDAGLSILANNFIDTLKGNSIL